MVITDNIAYAKFRKNLLIKNPKQFCDLCITNDVQGLRRLQNWGFQKYLQKYLEQKLKFNSKKRHNTGF